MHVAGSVTIPPLPIVRRRGRLCIVTPTPLAPLTQARFAGRRSETRSTPGFHLCYRKMRTVNAAQHGGRKCRFKKTAAVVTESNDAAATLPSPAHHSVEVPPGETPWARADDPTKAHTYPFALQQENPLITDSNGRVYSPKGNGPGRRKCKGTRVADHKYELGFDSAPAVWYWQVRAEAHHVCAAHAT